jgi:hypothetical protein
MKKIAIAAFALIFFFEATGAMAKTENNIDFSQPIKVSDIKIEKKMVLPKEDRQKKEETLKGKADVSLKNSKTKPVPIFTGATGVMGAPLQPGARKYAILIGLSNYSGITNDLCVNRTSEPYPTNLCADGDAINMEKTLKDIYGYDDVNSTIWRFSDADANFDDIKSAVDNVVANAQPGDEVVFLFSGHSATAKNVFRNGDRLNVGLALYNLPNDSGEIIWDGQLQNWFSKIATDRVAFIFDTCHAGGLASYLQASGREVVMSSAESQSSYTYYLGGEDGMLGEGMFAHYFNVLGMNTGLADGYNALTSNKTDDKVVAEEAFSYAKQYVPVMTANHQIPELNDKFADDLLLGY